MTLILLLLGLPGLIVLIDFVAFLFSRKQVVHKVLFRLTEMGSMIILPSMYGNFGRENDCCAGVLDTAVFSPDHQLSILVLIVLCLATYFYSSYRTRIATPVLEVLVNTLLLFGITLNVIIAIHTKEPWLAIGGNIPIILLAILALAKNQKLIIEHSKALEFIPQNRIERMAWNILNLRPIIKFPILFVFCLPILVVITSLLLLVGQKPDSFIKAFTDTYKHGFSQWDYKCDNVNCGGHYLCSVAANGHPRIVKPQRGGVRHGKNIVCNRQLLISNAFEELLQERTPVLHKFIRTRYNRVGTFIHRYYGIFNNKVLADIIYFLMKPFEWCFLLTLYTFDRDPENRIAKQYLSKSDRQQIDRIKRRATSVCCQPTTCWPRP